MDVDVCVSDTPSEKRRRRRLCSQGPDAVGARGEGGAGGRPYRAPRRRSQAGGANTAHAGAARPYPPLHHTLRGARTPMGPGRWLGGDDGRAGGGGRGRGARTAERAAAGAAAREEVKLEDCGRGGGVPAGSANDSSNMQILIGEKRRLGRNENE
ncbi:hypothetical protein CRUP_026145 [Coryphaenoides rupestris]|nr:hypothetical protein CRUP_026145 [Coryphaenoides rupestris]